MSKTLTLARLEALSPQQVDARACHDCGVLVPRAKMVGVGHRPDWVCLACFETHMSEARRLFDHFRALCAAGMLEEADDEA